jgi:hypothetical protein
VFDLGMSEGEDQIPIVILKVLPGNGYSLTFMQQYCLDFKNTFLFYDPVVMKMN